MTCAAIRAIVVAAARPLVAPFVAASGASIVVAKPGHDSFISQRPTAVIGFTASSRCNTDQNERHRWDASALTNQIVKLTLIVSDPGRHLLLQFFHRQNFDADIDDVADVKRQVLDKQIICNERILTELDFDGNALLHKIGLIVR